jgi:hypothetical protein
MQKSLKVFYFFEYYIYTEIEVKYFLSISQMRIDVKNSICKIFTNIVRVPFDRF